LAPALLERRTCAPHGGVQISPQQVFTHVVSYGQSACPPGQSRAPVQLSMKAVHTQLDPSDDSQH
jgi:hypothetical protein